MVQSPTHKRIVAVLVLAAIAGVAALEARRRPKGARREAIDTQAVTTMGAPRAALNRLWFDHLPTSAKDNVDNWLFLSGGLGVQIAGSGYRWSIEMFDFERAGNRLELVALQDQKPLRFTFEVKACDNQPPFDLRLVPSEPIRGKAKLYGFGDEEGAAERFEWVRDRRAAALSQVSAHPR